MATKGTVSSLRKKLLSRLSMSDDHRDATSRAGTLNSTTPAQCLGNGGEGCTQKKDWSVRRRKKNETRRRLSVAGTSSTPKQSTSRYEDVVDSLDHMERSPDCSRRSQPASAPVDLVASCNAHAQNSPASTSGSAVARDVITVNQQKQQGLLLTRFSKFLYISLWLVVRALCFSFYVFLSRCVIRPLLSACS